MHASAGIYHRFRAPLGISLTIGAEAPTASSQTDIPAKSVTTDMTIPARLKAEWRPSHSLSIYNTFSASRVKQGGYPYEYVPTGEIAYADTCSYKRTFLSDGLTVQWTTPHFTLSSISSWQYLDDEMRLDQDFLPDDYFTLVQARRENAVTQISFCAPGRMAARIHGSPGCSDSGKGWRWTRR